MKSLLIILFLAFCCELSFATSDSNYNKSIVELCSMLQGTKPISFKRAVFLIENAHYSGKLDYNQFCSQISTIKSKLIQIAEKCPSKDKNTKLNWAIYRYMVDSIPENNFKPFIYDLDNFMGDKDYKSFMVCELLKTKKGNCHSLPYLYRLLAEEIGAEAYLAIAPMHVYIRHKDNAGKWWNLELTSGTYSRTSFIIESFKVTDEGIESGLYMKPLSLKESVALCMNDLLYWYNEEKQEFSNEYIVKGYTQGLKAYPNSLILLSKIEDYKYRVRSKSYNNETELNAYKKQIDEILMKLKSIGYYSLSPQEYQAKVQEIETFKKQNSK